MKSLLQNKKILITAGPTREYLDPVRFISNESSGKMGYAIAEALHQFGADVYLVSGPVTISYSFPEEKIIHAKSAKQMYDACLPFFDTLDIAVFCAAVADYTPKTNYNQKIKKIENEIAIEFVKNIDIAFEFGKIKKQHQKSVGFALETNNVLDNTKAKLKKKNFDLIVSNSPNKDEGFGYDTNKICIIDQKLSLKSFQLKSKQEVAQDIVNAIIEMYNPVEIASI
ncbi:Probable Phosphopantothenate--cysteine ligase [Flavobacterium indicum GPTSA100-9 = DSM 17447]|uniref:Probable Phosphopantothenate--cysteine ligase n=1 Tax=Flavobacterium indicum (strain DSM 17447 / CIP 109464 / GPTSA100-9) TaxID=1094466 RepID=H8XTL7_FLAIG|nr:phosphopantothenoylcysteine decarboxylase [Flavobacterium indicum]CCG53597.1 Probable Phosphopantothenate--cysteine ligase [Flavobacterium indicum GPTSA100-9 = DSM 17447]